MIPMVDFSRKQRDTFLSGLIVVATFTAYWSVSRNGFVIYDDNIYVYENAHVREGLTFEGLAWAMTSTDHANWHPVTWMSHMLDGSLFGAHPDAAGFHHMTNVVVHVVNALLVFCLCRCMLGSSGLSAFVAACFALHPVHVESVAWIAERKDVLSTFFWLLCILAYLKYARWYERTKNANKVTTQRQWYWISFGCLVLGLMSKPMLVTTPFLLLLLDYWPLRRIVLPGKSTTSDKKNVHRLESRLESEVVSSGVGRRDEPREAGGRSWRELVFEKIPMFAMVLLSCMLTYFAQQKGGAVATTALMHRVANVAVAYVRYVGKTFWPQDLAVLYPYRVGMWQALHVTGAVTVLLVITVIVFWLRRRRYLAVGWLWFLGTLVPVIGLVQVGRHSIADRYLYMPMTGLLIMLAWGIAELVNHRPQLKWPSLAVALSLLATCWFLTFRQVSYWRDSKTLFSHALDVTEGNSVIHVNLGKVLQDTGDLDAAIGHFHQAIKIVPDAMEAHNNLGVALHASRKYAESIEAFQRALAIQKNDALILKNMGLVLVANGQIDVAVDYFRKSLGINEQNKEVFRQLGMALGTLGRHDEAIMHCRRAAQLYPADASLHNLLGTSLHQAGQFREAMQVYQQALRLDPELGDAYINLSELLAVTDEPLRAVEMVNQALKRQPGSLPLLKHLGSLLRRQKSYDKAILVYRRILNIEPDDADSHNQLGNIFAAKNKINKAAKHYRVAIGLQPKLASPRYNLALMLQRSGQTGQAVEQYRKVLKLDPSLAEVHNNLAVALEQLNDLDGALRHFRRSVELNPEHPTAGQHVRRLNAQRKNSN